MLNLYLSRTVDIQFIVLELKRFYNCWCERNFALMIRLTFQKMEMRQTLSVSVDWQNGINPARGPLQMGRLFKILKDSSLLAGVSF